MLQVMISLSHSRRAAVSTLPEKAELDATAIDERQRKTRNAIVVAQMIQVCHPLLVVFVQRSLHLVVEEMDRRDDVLLEIVVELAGMHVARDGRIGRRHVSHGEAEL